MPETPPPSKPGSAPGEEGNEAKVGRRRAQPKGAKGPLATIVGVGEPQTAKLVPRAEGSEDPERRNAVGGPYWKPPAEPKDNPDLPIERAMSEPLKVKRPQQPAQEPTKMHLATKLEQKTAWEPVPDPFAKAESLKHLKRLRGQIHQYKTDNNLTTPAPEAEPANIEPPPPAAPQEERMVSVSAVSPDEGAPTTANVAPAEAVALSEAGEVKISDAPEAKKDPEALTGPTHVREPGEAAPTTITSGHAEARKPRSQEPADLANASESVQQAGGGELSRTRADFELAKHLGEGVSSARADMIAKRDAYLAEYKAYHTRTSGVGRWVRRTFGQGEKGGKLGEALSAYEASQLAYSGKLEESVAKRLKERGKERDGKHKKLDGSKVDSPLEHARHNRLALERYRGLIRFNDVIKPLAEMKINARREALDAKGKGLFSKFLSFNEKSRKLLEDKFGKTGAIIVRAGATAAALTVAAGFTGSAAGVGLTALAGFGMYKFSRFVIGGLAGVGAGRLAGAAYDPLGRRAMEAASENLKNEGRTRGELTADSLRQFEQNRTMLASRADEQTFQNKKNAVSTIVAMVAGASASSAFAHGFGGGGATGDWDSGHHGAVLPAHAHEALAVGGRINDADRLMGHYAVKLQHDFGGNLDHAPKSVQAFVHALSPDGKSPLLNPHEDLATLKFFNMQHAHDSMLVRPGDSIHFDNAGQIVLDRAGTVGHPGIHHVLVYADGKLNPINASDWHTLPNPGEHHATAASGSDPNGYAKADQLMRDERAMQGLQNTPHTTETSVGTPVGSPESLYSPEDASSASQPPSTEGSVGVPLDGSIRR